MAHCDDEIICGWPIFQNKNIKKKIIIVSSDLKNKHRLWCSHRKFVFRELCRSFEIEQECMDYNSEFSVHIKEKKLLEKNIIDILEKNKFDFIYTHNFFGEYFHPDHIFLFNLIIQKYKNKIIISDIDYTNTKNRFEKKNKIINQNEKVKYFNKKILNVDLNSNIFVNVREYYKSFNVWTWRNDLTQKKASLYLL